MIKSIVDASALVALINGRDRHHGWAAEQVRTLTSPLITCESVLSESLYVLGNVHGGSEALYGFLENGIVEVSFDLALNQEFILKLMRKYEDLPISLADASLVRMSELFPEHFVFTLDSDFRTYRRFGRRVVPLIMP